jgi:hypothetical protein
MEIFAASAIYPGSTHLESLRAVYDGVSEWFGPLSTGHFQICPQHPGQINEKSLNAILAAFPTTKLRLHANCFVSKKRIVKGMDLNDLHSEHKPLKRLAALSKHINASTYSIHAGYKSSGTRDSIIDKQKLLSDWFECDVAVEHLYPTASSEYILDSYDDLKWMMDCALPMALDISHFQIIAKHSGYVDLDLLRQILNYEHLLEIHLSENDGCMDAHATTDVEPWYWKYLVQSKAASSHNRTQIFSEGNQRTKTRIKERVDRFIKNKLPKLLDCKNQ